MSTTPSEAPVPNDTDATEDAGAHPGGAEACSSVAPSSAAASFFFVSVVSSRQRRQPERAGGKSAFPRGGTRVEHDDTRGPKPSARVCVRPARGLAQRQHAAFRVRGGVDDLLALRKLHRKRLLGDAVAEREEADGVFSGGARGARVEHDCLERRRNRV
jgi:hypothetical protein